MNISTQIHHLPTYKDYLRVVSSIESYLHKKGYLKLDVPVLSPQLIPESYLEIFETQFRYLDKTEQLYLTPSPELFIKRLLAAGIGDCYSMGKSFRNSEPHSPKHEPEFTMLEMYKVGENYRYMAQEVLEMLQFIGEAHLKSHDAQTQITYQGKPLSFDKWEELTVAEAFERYAAIPPTVLFDEEQFIQAARNKGYTTDTFSYEDLWSQIYAQEIESHLGTSGYPTVLFDYPIQFAALSTPNSDNKTAQRFECYIEGIELGNCYSELTDWKLQEARLQNEYEERKHSGKIEHPIDQGFIDALKNGLPACTGIAIGVERLGMIFTDVQRIDDMKLITIA